MLNQDIIIYTSDFAPHFSQSTTQSLLMTIHCLILKWRPITGLLHLKHQTRVEQAYSDKNTCLLNCNKNYHLIFLNSTGIGIPTKNLQLIKLNTLVKPVNPYLRGGLCTVDLLTKIACFVKEQNYFSILKTVNLNLLVQGDNTFSHTREPLLKGTALYS